MFRVLCKNLKLEDNFNFSLLARLTPGYVGADLMLLCRVATMSVLDRILNTIKSNGSENNMEAETQENPPNQESVGLNGKMHESDSKQNVTSNTDTIPDFNYSDYLHWLRQPTLFTDSHHETACIELSDFKNALSKVQPSAKREGFATVPDVTWDDIGALESIREELTMAILVCKDVILSQ